MNGFNLPKAVIYPLSEPSKMGGGLLLAQAGHQYLLGLRFLGVLKNSQKRLFGHKSTLIKALVSQKQLKSKTPQFLKPL